jgi:hypothetical protein
MEELKQLLKVAYRKADVGTIGVQRLVGCETACADAASCLLESYFPYPDGDCEAIVVRGCVISIFDVS